ncbi:MAG: helix-turn-helix domain-containing protein [Oscillospiraceae bacterium]|nr:helix-turn-helix domain-containing protein [Oscillospiraceae bacterium]
MDTYTAVKNRILFLCDQKHMTINKLATASAVSPSTIKNILYGKSHNPGIVTLKMLCDGLGITISDFFDTPIFKNLEQEIK